MQIEIYKNDQILKCFMLLSLFYLAKKNSVDMIPLWHFSF